MILRSIPPVTSTGPVRPKRRERVSLQKFDVDKKPRSWEFATKPFFKRVKEPLVDVFKETKEVKIIIDLGSFSRGEVDIDIKPDKYVIFAKSKEQEFREEINLPPSVDIKNTVEFFKNGILEITLPKKKDRHKTGRKKKRRKYKPQVNPDRHRKV